jgi:Mg-chelatase subunit ChlD
MDYHVPIISATVIEPIPVSTARPELTKGRSSRFNLPNHKSHRLLDREISSLQDQGFPRGLAKTLSTTNEAFPLRIWVVDNSGSMRMMDGHKILETSNSKDVKLVPCTRWSEIQQTVEYHAQMAHLLKAPTIFRLMNDPGKVVGPQQFSIGENGETFVDNELSLALQTIINVSPGGVTPLSEHIRDIRENIRNLEPALRHDGTRVVIILATDGLPTDIHGRCDYSTKQEFTEALRTLEGLPVWIVIRLCTDEDDVVEFYNNLDHELELSMEVLDDFSSEAKEVCTHNPWLNYALPLHRCREMGYHNRLFDILDERRIGLDELREFLMILFGVENFDSVPDPQLDWEGFLSRVSDIVKNEKNQWNPVTRRVGPWIDMKKLDKTYKKSHTCCSVM